MDSCLLCLEFKMNVIKANTEKWQELNIKQVLEKHFWPLNSVEKSLFICLTCWQEVDVFHKFYTRIEEAHKIFSKINNFEYCFQEPEILLQQSDFPYTVDEKEHSSKESLDDTDLFEIVGRKGIDKKDPLGKCRNYINSKLKSVEDDSARNLARSKELLDKKNEEETSIKKEVEDLVEDEHSDRDDNNYENIFDPNNLMESDSAEKMGNMEQGESNENQRKKREDNDKFIAENLKEIKCDLCQVSFEDFPSLKRHFTVNHKQRGYVVCCKRKFHGRTSLIDHIRCHLNPDYYKCKECGKSLSERKSFKNHMLRVHRAHEVVKKHSCDICGKAFIKAHVLRDHMLTHLPEEEKKFPCKECGKNYASAHILNQHQQAVHLKRFAKICDICGKTFNSNAELKAHINKHEGIPAPILTCDVCGLRLTTAKGLKLHKINQHPVGGKQDHPCPYCAKVSPNLTALRKHVYRMHGKGYDYKCSICEKAFKRSETLKEHMAAHTGNALYTCQWCNMTFNSNGNMYAHRKKMHPKEWRETKLQKYATNISVDISNSLLRKQ